MLNSITHLGPNYTEKNSILECYMVKHSSLLCQVHSLLGRLQALTAKLNFGKKNNIQHSILVCQVE